MKTRSILRLLALHASLALATSAATTTTSAAGAPVRVLTVNVRVSTAKESNPDDSWASRRESLADLIMRHPDGNGPYDFVGTQETILHPDPKLNQRDYLAAKLTGHAFIGRSTDPTPERGASNILYWKKDRWRLDPADNGTFWLSATPGVPGSKAESARFTRTAVHGLFHELDTRGAPTGRKLYVYNTHFDHVGAPSREFAAKALLAHIAARNDKTAPVVLMGDFNCNEKSAPIRHLLGETVLINGLRAKPPLALVDTFAVANPGDTQAGTTNGFKAPRNTRIDFILATPDLRVLSSKIIRTRRPNGRYPTDHFPVETVLAWGDKADK